MVRESVAHMLAQAAEALPAGLTLSVTEGYRPIQAQRAMHAYMVKEISNEHPEWNFVHVELEAGMRSAPPDAVTPPPHLTGGAVDVEILDEQGNSLDFSSPFGRIDWRQARTLCAGLSDTACANRKLLKSVMEPTGFTNYVDEW